jgi:DNA-binding response OmpR family regulator
MARVFYIHWNEAELRERIAPLEAAGHEVRGHWSQQDQADLKDNLPDAVVISLDRLPSHGRQIAQWLWEAKKRQHIPIIFAGGQADKVAAATKQFPNAHSCATDAVPEVIDRLAAALGWQ